MIERGIKTLAYGSYDEELTVTSSDSVLTLTVRGIWQTSSDDNERHVRPYTWPNVSLIVITGCQ